MFLLLTVEIQVYDIVQHALLQALMHAQKHWLTGINIQHTQKPVESFLKTSHHALPRMHDTLAYGLIPMPCLKTTIECQQRLFYLWETIIFEVLRYHIL